VVQDMLGGDLLMAEVRTADGSRQGVHYWNRLPGGVDLDFTREQFRGGEVVGDPRQIERPQDVTRGRLAGHYHLLAARVNRALGEGGTTPASRAVTVKGVCVRADGCVLLCRNHRGQWELPGGRPEVGELFQDCLRRELREETGAEIAVDSVLGVHPLEVLPGVWLDVVAYECIAPARSEPDALRPSPEHVSVAFRDPAKLAADELPGTYRQLIARRAYSRA
jgi:8-oxo-dGTP pyrophosphatase MutT (NUDIX family)